MSFPEYSRYVSRLEDYLLPALVVVALLAGVAIALTLINRYRYEVERNRLEEEWLRLDNILHRTQGNPKRDPLAYLETGEGAGNLEREIENLMNKASGPDKVALVQRAKELHGPERYWFLDGLTYSEDLESLSRQAVHGFSKWRRIWAIVLLGLLEHEDTLGVLEQCLQDRDQDVVYYTARMLAEMEEIEAAKTLLDLFGTDRINPKLLVAMLEESPARVEGLVREKLESQDPKVRMWAATLLEISEEEESVERLIESARDEDPDVRSASVRSLSNIGDEKGKEALPGALEDQAWFVKAGAAQAAGRLGATEFSGQLIQLLHEESWWVRQNAKTALLALCPEVEEEVIEHLSSEDRFARNMVVEILEGAGTVERKTRELEKDTGSEEALRFFRLLLTAEGRGSVESAARNAKPEAREALDGLLESAEHRDLGKDRSGSQGVSEHS